MNDTPRSLEGRGAIETPQRGGKVKFLLAVAAAFFFCAFVALGTWQVKRLQWKEDLIARIDARVHAEPVAAPPRARWPQVTAESDEYRRVRVAGTFLYDFTTRVQTTTRLGIGFWLMTPLCTADGIVFVNRGFVPMRSGDLQLPAPPKASGDVCAAVPGRKPAVITGLLRLPEPKGRVLRENDPAGDRWYTRDIGPMAAARNLRDVAPFFVDAPAGQEYPASAAERPTGGLTVIAFPNNHLVYAGTWFALAAMIAGGYYLVLRYDRASARARRRGTSARTGNDDGSSAGHPGD
ncbi:surfeit locus 1 family protein [Pseudoduganella lurida]|uniref:SURF1-like protein n=1 Tax=Pseudoduganella lurida TaxID=1036180 RepID=A0A562RED3_9BURK|nr:SURF1 family protein [Pseudoduganella lurida]TWI67283.1 surfeit locus 1 family protein [Pseudoduganella lurida]